MTKAGFYLMGLKGLSCLDAVILFCGDYPEKASISYVVAARDKNVLNDYFDEIQSLATKHNLLFFERTIAALLPEADVMFAIGWRWLIKEDINKLIVFHDSLLPKYRGFSPLVTALIEGDDEIGVTGIHANAEFDKGNIVGAKKISITYPIKIETAIERISVLYKDLLVETLQRLSAGVPGGIVQDERLATYSLWRDEADYHIDWSQSAERICRFIDAVGYPYNGAFTLIDGSKIRILEAEQAGDLNIVNRIAGKVLFLQDNCTTVVCGTGLLKIILAVDETGEKIAFTKLRARLT
jgi:methionyl-tRNA formyltransferase